jgi:RNA-directed DNA polymerase
MEESHTEGPASHGDPESCAGSRKAPGEALTGAHTGGASSREIRCNQGADAVVLSGRQHAGARQGERTGDPARSETSGTCGNSMRGNREIPCPARDDGTVRNGRGLAKENAGQQNTLRMQSREGVPSALDRVRQVALRNRKERFSALFHHLTIDRLRAAFLKIKKDAAAGSDGVRWEQYERDLEANLRDLHDRLHKGAYRARPSRRAYIPKADGRQRPLGIAALEDKIVQRAMAEVLYAIYEVDFLGFSYGFRPGRRAHQALDALAVGIVSRRSAGFSMRTFAVTSTRSTTTG